MICRGKITYIVFPCLGNSGMIFLYMEVCTSILKSTNGGQYRRSLEHVWNWNMKKALPLKLIRFAHFENTKFSIQHRKIRA